jgi:hypothetical protein
LLDEKFLSETVVLESELDAKGYQTEEQVTTLINNALVDIPEIGESIIVDDELSGTSINPVQNKIITARLNEIDNNIQSLLNIDYNELAFDTTEIVVNSTTNTTSVLGQAILGQMVLA